MDTVPQLQATPEEPFRRIAIAVIDGTARSIRHRQQQLNNLYNGLLKSRSELITAIQDDSGLNDAEALFEYSLACQEIRMHHENLDFNRENVKARSLERKEDALEHATPYGIVYIVVSTGLCSALSPLAAAISAGSCVVLELPQTTSYLNGVLRKLLPGMLSRDTFVITTKRPNSTSLSRCCIVLPHDITGDLNTTINSVTSPSSGACLAFVDRDADVVLAAHSIFNARFSFNGKSSYGPDIAFVHEAVMDLFKHRFTQLWVECSFSRKKGHYKKGQPDQYDGFVYLHADSQGAVIEVEEKSHGIKLPEFKATTLVLCPIGSTDEGIDLAEQLCGNTTPAAAFIFAGPKSANYLAQSVDAHLNFVNYIPVELSVGPRVPQDGSGMIVPRYSPSMFRQRRPQLSNVSEISNNVGGLTLDNTKLACWAKSMQAPLPRSDEKDGKRVDFFEQAIRTSAAVSLSLVVAMGVGAALLLNRWRVWK